MKYHARYITRHVTTDGSGSLVVMFYRSCREEMATLSPRHVISRASHGDALTLATSHGEWLVATYERTAFIEMSQYVTLRASRYITIECDCIIVCRALLWLLRWRYRYWRCQHAARHTRAIVASVITIRPLAILMGSS